MVKTQGKEKKKRIRKNCHDYFFIFYPFFRFLVKYSVILKRKASSDNSDRVAVFTTLHVQPVTGGREKALLCFQGFKGVTSQKRLRATAINNNNIRRFVSCHVFCVF